MKVIYFGEAHVRQLNAADLKKAGVEGFKHTEFNRGEAVEVDDAVGQALLTNRRLFGGDFKEVEQAPELPLDTAPEPPTVTVRPKKSGS